MKALVLSGGSIKGAFQAGAIRGVLEAGYRPEIITGISVGALNGSFLVSRSARAKDRALDWPAIAGELVSFWLQEIDGPAKLLKRRSALDIGWRALTRKWSGVVDMERMYELVRRTLAATDFTDPPLRSAFGAVSLETGGIVYSPDDPGTQARVIDYIIASTQEPIGMALYPVDGQSFYDGGIRDLAPLKRAIRLGASQIVCIACQPEDPGPLEWDFNRGDPLALVGRVLDIVTNELLNNDLETLLETNRLLAQAGDVPALHGKRCIPLLVVRPETKIPVNVTAFGPQDISEMIRLGGERAARRITDALADPRDPGYDVAVGLTQDGERTQLDPAA